MISPVIPGNATRDEEIRKINNPRYKETTRDDTERIKLTDEERNRVIGGYVKDTVYGIPGYENRVDVKRRNQR